MFCHKVVVKEYSLFNMYFSWKSVVNKFDLVRNRYEVSASGPLY